MLRPWTRSKKLRRACGGNPREACTRHIGRGLVSDAMGGGELILRQPESSDGAAPCNRSTPLILPSTWLLSSVHQPGSSPPACLGPRSHICIGSRAVIRPPCSLSSRRCAPVLLAGSTPRLVLC